VIATQRDQFMRLSEIDQQIEYGGRIRPPVHVVAQSDDCIVGAKIDRFHEGRQRNAAAVNITDREVAFHVIDPLDLGLYGRQGQFRIATDLRRDYTKKRLFDPDK
jgi:hypothetical protein